MPPKGYRALCDICNGRMTHDRAQPYATWCPRIQEDNRWAAFKYRYGLSKERYEELAKAQEYRCAICRRFPRGDERLRVDHNHETGEIRSLLCRNCNSGLGFFEDDRRLLKLAAAYLSYQRGGPKWIL